MILTIKNCSDKKFEEVVDSSVHYFVNMLMGKRIVKNIKIDLVFADGIDSYGSSIVKGYNASHKPRKFEIEIRSHIGAKATLKTIAHEIVHVKQFVKNELDYALTKWKGKVIDTEKVDYYQRPWEIEAFGLTYGLYTNYCLENKLWEHLEGIENPLKFQTENIVWKD